jgi:signal transduction histidine kinase/CheY-like chemotaxis protein
VVEAETPAAEVGATRPVTGAAGALLTAALLYFIAAWAARLLTVPGMSVAALWLPVGVQVAGYTLTPVRRWAAMTLAFAAGNVLFTATAAYPFALAAIYLPIDLAEGLLAATLVRRFVGPRPRMSSVRELVGVLAAVVVATAAGALASALAVGSVDALSFRRAFTLWWAGNSLGGALVAPTVLAWPREGTRRRPARIVEAVGLGVVALGAAAGVFVEASDMPVLEFLLLPAWLWAALRFGIPAVGAVGAIHAVTALLAVRAGVGPLITAGYSSLTVSAYLQLLMGVELCAFQVLAAAMKERRTALAQARAAEERFDAFLRNAPLLVSVKDAASRMLALSAEFEKLFRVPVVALLGKTNGELFPPELARQLDDEDARVLREGGPLHVSHQFTGRLYEVTKFRVRSADGTPLICAISEDVTERRASETTARMAALGTLAAGVAHEINNPLAFVLANVSFAADRLEAAPRDPSLAEAADALREAGEGALRVRDIVRDLRSFARPPGEAEQTRVDLRTPLRAALTMARNEVRHRARIVEDLGEPPPVLADEHQLAQVFLNLVVNAAQAIPDGSVAANEVRLRTGRTVAGEAFAEVEDTGRGMTEEERRRAFEPFFTTKPFGGGLGLGLFLSANIVRGLGGRIELETAPDRGSTFRVVFPAAPAVSGPERAPAEATTAAPSPRSVRLRVLVVDDEPLVGRSVERLLRKEHHVDAVTDPNVALARIGAGERWDVVLCDLMMPQLSGMEFDARLAERAPELRARTVYVTGGAFTERAQAFLATPGRRTLAKPFDAATLRAVIAEVGPAEDRGQAGARPSTVS